MKPAANNPHAGHRQRLREAFIEDSAGSLQDHQLLELLLTFSIPRADTNPAAHALLAAFGSLNALFGANVRDIAKVEGVGAQSAVLISLVGALSRRAAKAKRGARVCLNTPDDATRFCTGIFPSMLHEETYCVSLDNKRNVLHVDRVAAGTPSENIVYPRLVAETALRHGASSVILSHNHPSGSAQPSRADIEATRLVCNALTGIGIALHDHIIIGDGEAFSMVRNAYLPSGGAEEPVARAADKDR